MSVNFNPKVDPRVGVLGGYTVNPTRVVSSENTGNEYGISIPQNHSYTQGVNGEKISLGQDAVGCAHRNPEEFNFHMIA